MTRTDELREVFPRFSGETRHAFAFLEHSYGYRLVDEEIDTERPEWTSESHYVRARVGVAVHLGASGPYITVSFVALLQPDVYQPGAYFPDALPEWPRAIELDALVCMLGHHDDPDFLLPPYPDPLDFPESPRASMEPPPWLTTHLAVEERRVQLLNADLPGVLAGLARATRRYAATILEGDTSMFPAVQDYVAVEHRRRYPPRRYRQSRRSP